MGSQSSHQLTFKQTAYLAVSALIIYFPIILYVNFPSNGKISFRTIPFLILPAGLSLFVYFLWIIIIEWLLEKLVAVFGEKFLTEFKLPAQLLGVPVAVAATAFSHFLFKVAFIGMFRVLSLFPGYEAQLSHEKLAHRISNQQIETLRKTNTGLTIVIMLSIFYLGVNRRANKRMKDIQVEAERNEKEKVLAQFAALKNQVSPHFLFNSLSILSSLVHVDPNLSEKFIDQLSRAYRYILEQKDNDRILLKTELAFITSYIFLLKLRFEDKFDVEMAVSESDANHFEIAPLTLQLLIENCVKHNRMSTRNPLQVKICIEGKYLIVSNPIQPRQQKEESTGIGLQNILNRYALLTQEPAWIGEKNDAFVVKVPLLVPVSV